MSYQSCLNKFEKKKVKENSNDVTSNAIISVCVQAYQHADYIGECLDGILNQKTDFPFEILLGEDDSSDGTRETCIQYARNHPDKIRLFLHHRENNIIIGGLQSGRFNFLYNLYSSKGKYIAICEGDDYWTDPLKLQKQVTFLETHPEYSLCFHNALKLYQNEERQDELFGHYTKHEYSQKDIIHEWLIPTASAIFRNVFLDREIPEYFCHLPIGDFPLFLYLGESGKYRYLDETMSVYRVLSTGAVKTNLTSEKYYLMSRKLSKELAFYYRPKFKLDFAIRIAFDNYYLARFAAKKGERKKALSFLYDSLRADPWMMLRSRKNYRYITLRRLLPKIIRDILRGKTAT